MFFVELVSEQQMLSLYCSFNVAQSTVTYFLRQRCYHGVLAACTTVRGDRKMENAYYTVTVSLEIKMPPLCKVCRVHVR